jgi:hypothetical protein
MAGKRFSLVARVSTDSPGTVRSVLEKLYGKPSVSEGSSTDEFIVRAKAVGASAKELNRSLLSELRRAEKRTRLRAEWTSGDRTERFFDYVLKGIAGSGEET